HKVHDEDLSHPCTTGIDCSGFVCRVWNHSHVATNGFSKFTTPVVQRDSLSTGDAFLRAGEHVILFIAMRENGDLLLYEAKGHTVHKTEADWSYVEAYIAVRYNNIIN